jgi:predicted DNA-binding protein with PD1-like motif
MSIEAHALRLSPGDDLREGIARYCAEKQLKAACIVAVVGSLKTACLRFAGRNEATVLVGDLEILSLSGTVAAGGKLHAHLSVADRDGHVAGGHALEGCIVRTTAEIILGELPGYEFARGHDPATGYHELQIKKAATPKGRGSTRG